jgi:hypothetical protein
MGFLSSKLAFVKQVSLSTEGLAAVRPAGGRSSAMSIVVSASTEA